MPDEVEKMGDYFQYSKQRDKLVFLAGELIELHEKRCQECMKDRIECTLKPHCTNRKYLDVLISIGRPENKLPSFCYEQRKLGVQRYLQKKTNISNPVDVILPFYAFLNLVLPNRALSSKTMTKETLETLQKDLVAALKKTMEKVVLESDDENIILVLEDMVHIANVSCNIITINAQTRGFVDENELKLVITALSRYYDMQFEIREIIRGWWYVTLVLPSTNPSLSDDKKTILKRELQKITNFGTLEDSNGSTRITFEVKTPSFLGEHNNLIVRDVTNVFDVINKALNPPRSQSKEVATRKKESK